MRLNLYSTVFTFFLSLFAYVACSQTKSGLDTTKAPDISNPASETAIEFERPLNFFASAGVSYRLYGLPTVTISPIDNNVQIEQASRLNSRISFGLVWNPFINSFNRISALTFKSKFIDQTVKQSIQAARSNLAFALLINVYQLSFSQNQSAATSPIDIGFGLGYRNKDLLIMGTIDFTPYRVPKQYFVDIFKDKPAPLMYKGSTDAIKTISLDDNSIYESRLHAFIGVKVAYAFTNSEKKAVAASNAVKKEIKDEVKESK